VRKLRPDGSEAFAWPGIVLRKDDEGIVLRAEFNVDVVEREFVTLRRGDIFIESYYWDRCYNIFEISSADGSFKGWYCNLGLPPRLDPEAGGISYVVLALDVCANPDGTFVVLDEEELAALLEQYSELVEAAERGREALLTLVAAGRLPRWTN
jgi:protein associated with RNAse G/E